MLSFDISDKQINVVKGSNAGGKIRIDRSCQIAVEDDMINNGEIVNLSGVAQLITSTLKAEQMMDREAVISFSSSNIVFKELIIPRAKGEQLLTMVQNQMVHEMGITNEYSISYTVVGDAGEKNPGALKVLATACPSSIVDSYRKLFSIAGISLKSVNICCNSITRIVLADQRNLEKMPLLVIQISPDMLGLTLFENGQMAFARYTPISEDDYDSENYIIEAINENIFRMTQFNKARGGSGISNVILYGQIGDYIALSDALLQMDVQASILPVPSTITGFENFEFTDFANAIGALYRRNKLTERINLLEIDSKTGRSNAGLNSFLITAGISIAASILVIFAITFIIGIRENSIRDDIDSVQTQINEANAKILEAQKYNLVYTNLSSYTNMLNDATSALNSLPIVTKATFDKLAAQAEEAGGNVTYKTFSYNIAGTVTIGDITLDSTDDPRAFIKVLIESGEYADVAYSGWTIDEESDKVKISSLTLKLSASEEEQEDAE